MGLNDDNRTIANIFDENKFDQIYSFSFLKVGLNGPTGLPRSGLTLLWDYPEDLLPELAAVLVNPVGPPKPTSRTRKTK